MEWVALISSIISLFKMVFSEAAKKKQNQIEKDGVSVGRILALKEVFDEAANLLSQAEFARRVFRDNLRDHAASLSDDDGYKRPRPTGITDGR